MEELVRHGVWLPVWGSLFTSVNRLTTFMIKENDYSIKIYNSEYVDVITELALRK